MKPLEARAPGPRVTEVDLGIDPRQRELPEAQLLEELPILPERPGMLEPSVPADEQQHVAARRRYPDSSLLTKDVVDVGHQAVAELVHEAPRRIEDEQPLCIRDHE